MSKLQTLQPHNLYGNILVLAPNGTEMFRCDEKKARWYVSRELATRFTREDGQEILQLNFEPKGYGLATDSVLLELQDNRCVVCGSTEKLIKHYLTPVQYRKHFPEEKKSRRWWDLVMLCSKHQYEYDLKAQQLSKELAEKYNAPLDGVGMERTKRDRAHTLAYVLVNHSLPDNVRTEKFAQLHELIGREVSSKELEEMAKQPKFQEWRQNYKTHGQLVVEKLESLDEFIQMWTNHFLNTMQPQFLPAHLC